MSSPAGHARAQGAKRAIPLSAYAIFLGFFALLLFISHLSFLRLPYFWDEAMQFIPAALDFLHGGSLVPTSVRPNIHPPGVMIYLAGVWRIAGYSPAATRSAMLLVSAFGLLAAFLLAIELSKEARGMPAFLAAALLFACPLFFAQSMLAQLDAPAMLFTTLALLFFLQNRVMLSAAVCVALVLTKETGLAAPVVFGALLARERRWREASYFLAPAAALAAWITALHSVTGNWAGNPNFAWYNLVYPLNPVRVGTAVLRRLYFLFVADFRWIGTIALLTVWRHGMLRNRPWRVAFLLVAVYAAMFSVCGGAVLERYLLPVMPIVFAAMAAALSLFRVRQQVAASLILFGGSAAGNLINPPYPFPLDNNLAFTDFLKLQSDAAEYLSHWYPRATVTTAWPLTMELRHPDLGYTRQPIPVAPIANFAPATLDGVHWKPASVVVVFSRYWDPPHSLMRLSPVRDFWERFHSFVPEVDEEDARTYVPFPIEQRLHRRGLWLDIYVSPDAPRGGPTPVQTAMAPEPSGWRRGTDIPAAESSYALRRGTPDSGAVGPREPPAPTGSIETPGRVPPTPRGMDAAAVLHTWRPDRVPELRRLQIQR
jgi:hypothetical protein